MPSQHHAIGLQTGCMVIVLAPVVEAARLPRVCPMALGYGLPPCYNNNPEDVASLEIWSIGCVGRLPREPAAGERPPRALGLGVFLPFRHA